MRSLAIIIGAALIAGSACAKMKHEPFSGRRVGVSRVGDRVPNLDVKRACQNASIGTDACLTDEEAAHQMLVEKWSSFPARDKASCDNEMRTVVRTISYINLVNCLLMDAHARAPLPPAKQ